MLSMPIFAMPNHITLHCECRGMTGTVYDGAWKESLFRMYTVVSPQRTWT